MSPPPDPRDPPPAADSIGDFSSACRYLDARIDLERRRLDPGRVESDFRLDRTRAMLDRVGRGRGDAGPGLVHVAGTKGKGSTSAMIDAMFRGTGRRCGLYTSPHLVDVRERIAIDGKPIGGEAFARSVRRTAEAAEAARIDDPHFFELLTVAALDAFADAGLELAVLETGLGGRLDATNVVVPEICVITRIGFDHVELLGPTLDRIAREKAGIMKPGVPVISTPQLPEAEAVLREVAAAAGAPIEFVCGEIESAVRIVEASDGRKTTRLDLHLPGRPPLRDLVPPLPGHHQGMNAAAATAAVLRRDERRRLVLDEAGLRAGLASARITGRLERLPGDPPCLVDGAHDVLSVAALVDTLRHVEPRGRIGLIFGCNADKDAAGMIAELVRGRREGVIDRLVTTRAADQPRSRSPEELRVLAGPGFGDRVAAAPHLAASWDVLSAMGNAEPADLVVVAGSFYLAGEAKRQRERGGGGLGAAPGSGRRGGRGRAASV